MEAINKEMTKKKIIKINIFIMLFRQKFLKWLPCTKKVEEEEIFFSNKII
jgi:hypothetical protein